MPEYYEIIKQPIDLRLIAQKIQSNSYSSVENLSGDLMLMIHNAKLYHSSTSDIYKVKIRYTNVYFHLNIFCDE